MPKRIFAVTNLKVGSEQDQFWAAGTQLSDEDTAKFTRDQLKELHDIGAIEVRVVDEEVPAEEEAEANPDAGAEPAPNPDEQKPAE